MENATITTLTAQFPLVEDLIALKETTWLNPRTTTLEKGCRRADQSRRGRRACAPQPLRAVSGESLPETAARHY
jgi:D-serine dehydratase